MSDYVIHLLGVSFDTEEEQDLFMSTVETDDEVFGFDCIGIDLPLESVVFKPVETGFLFLFLTEEDDVKGELMVLSEAFPGVHMEYVIISNSEREGVFSLQIEGGEILSSQTIIGEAANILREMAKGGFAG